MDAHTCTLPVCAWLAGGQGGLVPSVKSVAVCGHIHTKLSLYAIMFMRSYVSDPTCSVDVVLVSEQQVSKELSTSSSVPGHFGTCNSTPAHTLSLVGVCDCDCPRAFCSLTLSTVTCLHRPAVTPS